MSTATTTAAALAAARKPRRARPCASVHDLPEDVLTACVFEALLVEEAAAATRVCRAWRGLAVFAVRALRRRGAFDESCGGRVYLHPPSRTAGRVVTLRVGNDMLQRTGRNHVSSSSSSSSAAAGHHGVPVAPTSPASYAPPPTSSRSMGAIIAANRIQFTLESHFMPAKDTSSQKGDAGLPPTTTKKAMAKRKKKPAPRNRVPLARRSANPATSLLSPPRVLPKVLGGATSRVIKVGSPAHAIAPTDPDVRGSGPSTPPGAAGQAPGGVSRHRALVRRGGRGKIFRPHQSTKRTKSKRKDAGCDCGGGENGDAGGMPYMWIDPRTGQCGTLAAALGPALVKYFRSKHLPREHVKRSGKATGIIAPALAGGRLARGIVPKQQRSARRPTMFFALAILLALLPRYFAASPAAAAPSPDAPGSIEARCLAPLWGPSTRHFIDITRQPPPAT